MERTWEIQGLYARWRMTITVDPPEDGRQVDLMCWRESDLDNLAGHFQDAAMLWEMYEVHERTNARRTL
jgi:hypothetical protein